MSIISKVNVQKVKKVRVSKETSPWTLYYDDCSKHFLEVFFAISKIMVALKELYFVFYFINRPSLTIPKDFLDVYKNDSLAQV